MFFISRSLIKMNDLQEQKDVYNIQISNNFQNAIYLFL